MLETKGRHLLGNADTEYKRNVARIYSEVGREVTWQQLSDDLGESTVTFHVLGQGVTEGRGCPPELLELLSELDASAGAAAPADASH